MRHANYQTSAGQKRQPPGYRFATDRYDQFQIIYVSKGTLYFTSRDQQSALGEGDVAILGARSSFNLSCLDEGYRGVYFVAMGDLPGGFRCDAGAIHANVEIRTLAALMDRQIVAPNPDSASILDGLGLAMAWESVKIARTDREKQDVSQSPRYWAESARQVIDATIYSARTARDVLSSIPLSYRQLSRYFCDVLEMSPKQYQIHARTDEAKRLLTNTRLTITNIAMELGYASSQHFATQFLSVTNMSPSKWRKAVIGNS